MPNVKTLTNILLTCTNNSVLLTFFSFGIAVRMSGTFNIPEIRAISQFDSAMRNRVSNNRPGELIRIRRHERVDILKQCIDWIASHKDVSVTTICVDKSRKNSGEDIYSFAWKILMQRFENTLRHNNFPGPRNPDDRGMILPDNTSGDKLNALLRKMRRFNPVSHDTFLYPSGYRDQTLDYIIEDHFLKNSKNSLFTQMVDVIAYCVRQLYEPNQYLKKKGGRNFYNRLEPVMNKYASRSHPMGIVEI